MNIDLLKTYIENTWDSSAVPQLMDYIRIPAISPGFDKNWNQSGFLLKAARLVENWCRGMALHNCTIQTLTPEGKTPLILIDVAATRDDCTDTILFYGHIDKQPESMGWDENKGPWEPVLENDRLYGRGGADDAYSVFTAMIAIKALQEQNLPHERCVILIEACEESGSFDLKYYLEACRETIGTPTLVVCLDSGCCDYRRLWLTTTLRGSVNGILSVDILTEGIHSGNSGAVASSFRIMRQLLDRIEDSATGDILIDSLNVDIPGIRMEQIRKTVQILGSSMADAYPLVAGARPVSADMIQSIVNRTWRPTLSYTGMSGIPSPDRAGNVLRPGTSLMLAFRTPPTADSAGAADRIKHILEQDPPYGARVNFNILKAGQGWEIPPMDPDFENNIRQSSMDCFDNEPGFMGEGGGIPLMNMLARKFPGAAFIVTGVLGPHSNAHGPNEFLHIPFVKKLTCAIACIMARRCGHK